MTPSASRIVIASAGSGKTTWIVKDALAHTGRCAVVSYTNNNTGKAREKFAELAHAAPDRVSVMTWFGFLLRDLVRPYQNFYRDQRIDNVFFPDGRSAPYAKKDSWLYYFAKGGSIYSDKLAEFVLLCNAKSGGLVFKRLRDLYQVVYIDEAQDLAGYDLELVEAAMKAGVRVCLVGDNRQATYSTNNSPKNSAFRGPKIIDKFRAWKKAGLCGLEEQAWSYRCNQTICTLADSLFPDSPTATSRSSDTSGHEGVFLVAPPLLDRYVAAHRPQVLVYSRTADSNGYPGLNFGDSKGLEFPRVLIFPTGPIRKWLRSGDPDSIDSDISRAKLYVAITRARHSVAFSYDGVSALPGVRHIEATDLF